MRKLTLFVGLLIACSVINTYSQTNVTVSRITAPAAGAQTSANSDSVTQCTSCTWAVNEATPANVGVYAEDVAETAGGNLAMAGTVRRDTAASSAGTTGDNATLNTDAVGALWVRTLASGATGAAPPTSANYVAGLQSGATGGFLGGLTICDSYANVNVVTATTTLLVTGVAGRHVRICGFSLLTVLANNVALISGTGATCGTGTTGMTGGTTAATGYNFAAGAGIAQGSGIGAINQTNATGDSVCVITSAATQLSGRIAYAIY